MLLLAAAAAAATAGTPSLSRLFKHFPVTFYLTSINTPYIVLLTSSVTYCRDGRLRFAASARESAAPRRTRKGGTLVFFSRRGPRGWSPLLNRRPPPQDSKDSSVAPPSPPRLRNIVAQRRRSGGRAGGEGGGEGVVSVSVAPALTMCAVQNISLRVGALA